MSYCHYPTSSFLPTRHNRGFTVIEIVVTLFLSLTVITFFVSNFSEMSNDQRFEATLAEAQKIVNVAEKVRVKLLASGREADLACIRTVNHLNSEWQNGASFNPESPFGKNNKYKISFETRNNCNNTRNPCGNTPLPEAKVARVRVKIPFNIKRTDLYFRNSGNTATLCIFPEVSFQNSRRYSMRVISDKRNLYKETVY